MTHSIEAPALRAKAQRAARAFGKSFCREVFERYRQRGDDASAIAAERGMQAHQVDAAIDCGQELASLEAAAAAGAPLFVKYEGRVPQSLRDYCNAHPHLVVEVSCGAGYATDSGKAYDVLLRAGWSAYDDVVHTVIESTVAGVLRELRGVRRLQLRRLLQTSARGAELRQVMADGAAALAAARR